MRTDDLEEQYFVRFPLTSGALNYVEFRDAAGRRPFHVSVRGGVGKIVINDMEGGQWGRETWLDLPPSQAGFLTMLIIRHGDYCFVVTEGASLAWHMRLACDASPPLKLHRQNAEARWLAPHERATLDIEGGRARATILRLAGQTIPIPPEVPAALTLGWQYAAQSGSDALLAALLTVSERIETALILDEGWAALALACLWPGSAITAVTNTAEDAAALNRVARENSWADFVALEWHAGDPLPELGSPGWVQGTADHPLRASLRIRDTPAAAGRPVVPALPRAAWTDGLDVVVALYNQSSLIVDCVDSILTDSPQDVRVLVVDDGSTDTSAARLRQHFGDRLSCDPGSEAPVVLLEKPNGGCASARNFGRLLSDRDYIAFVDADDAVDPGFFSSLLALARETGDAVVQGGFVRVDAASPENRVSVRDIGIEDAITSMVGGIPVIATDPRTVMRHQPSIWRRVYRHRTLDMRGHWFPESVSAFDDLAFQCDTLGDLPRLWTMRGPKYRYTQHPGQDVRAMDERHFNNLHQMALFLDRAEAEGKPLPATIVEIFLDVSGWSLSGLRGDLIPPYVEMLAALVIRLDRHNPDKHWRDHVRSRVLHPDMAFALDRRASRTSLETGGFCHPEMVRFWRRLPGMGPW